MVPKFEPITHIPIKLFVPVVFLTAQVIFLFYLIFLLLVRNLSIQQLFSFNSPFLFDQIVQNFSAAGSLFLFSVVAFGIGVLSQFYSLILYRSEKKLVYLNILLFLFSFTVFLLILVKSIFLFFILWEMLGLLSFLLIGFWFKRTETQLSGLRAVFINRVGDVCLFLVFVTLQGYGLSTFDELPCGIFGSQPMLFILI